MSKRKKPSAADKGEALLRRALKAAPHATPELIEAVRHAPPTLAEVQQVQQQALALQQQQMQVVKAPMSTGMKVGLAVGGLALISGIIFVVVKKKGKKR